MRGYYGSNVSPLTLSRQALHPIAAEAVTSTEARDLAPSVRGDAVEAARAGLTLMSATVWQPAVQYVQPVAPVLGPVINQHYPVIRDVAPPELAVAIPQYTYAAIDSRELTDGG